MSHLLLYQRKNSFEQQRIIEEALAVGADGYLMKDCGREELLRAIRGASGEVCMSFIIR